MSDTDSTFLDNTRKDLIGATTAAVILAAFLHTPGPRKELDAELKLFLSGSSDAIDAFVCAVLSAAIAEEIRNEVRGTLSELISNEPGYYDRRTVNALLSLYGGEPHLKDFSAAAESDFRASCMRILQKKLTDLVSTALWCRVDAYERGSSKSALNLSAIHSSCLSLLPFSYREDLGSADAWVNQVKSDWRNSDMTQKALRLTADSSSGLTELLSQL